jgi:putative IMPACT (imprinted ancient) family translation regulator
MLLAEFLFVTTDYDGYSILLKLLNNENVAVNNTEFLNNIKVSLAVKKEYSQTFCDRLVDSFNGKIKIDKLNEDFYPF